MAKSPVIPGHEVIGTVVALGPGVKNWKVGDRAGGAWHGGHDGLCKWCNRCMFQMCENELVNGVSRNGGWSEYCLLRSEAAVHVPSDVDPAEFAPLLCAGITTFNTIRKMHVIQGDTVAIYGVGGLGHLAIRMGYRTVAISTSEEKRRFALQLGLISLGGMVSPERYKDARKWNNYFKQEFINSPEDEKQRELHAKVWPYQ